jgi:chaperonin GroES
MQTVPKFADGAIETREKGGTLAVITLYPRVLNTFPKTNQNPSIIMAGIKPLGDRVLVKPDLAEEKTASGLFIPDTAKEKPQRGTVVAVGAGKVENGTKIDMTVKAGDKVLYGKYSGTEVSINGEELMIMRESDILGVIS